MKRCPRLFAAMMTIILAGIPVTGCMLAGDADPDDQTVQGTMTEGAGEGELAVGEPARLMVVSAPGAEDAAATPDRAAPMMEPRQMPQTRLEEAVMTPEAVTSGCSGACGWCEWNWNSCATKLKNTRWQGFYLWDGFNGICYCNGSVSGCC